MTTGHEVFEDMITSLSRKEVPDKVATALVASSEFHVQVTGGLAAAAFSEDGIVLNPSHRRVPPQTGQICWVKHISTSLENHPGIFVRIRPCGGFLHAQELVQGGSQLLDHHVVSVLDFAEIATLQGDAGAVLSAQLRVVGLERFPGRAAYPHQSTRFAVVMNLGGLEIGRIRREMGTGGRC